MTGSRQRILIIAASASLGLLLADWYLLTPLLDRRQAALARRDALQKELASNSHLILRSRQEKRLLNLMRSAGLKASTTEAESQLLNTLRTIAQDCGVVLSSVKPERTATVHQMQEMIFQAAGSGNTASLVRLLYRLHTSPLPIRIREIQVSSRADGQDDLTFTLRLSTLVESGTAADRPLPARVPGAEGETTL